MTLKKCSCGKLNTTKTAKFIGTQDLIYKALLFNCSCGSTFQIMNKQDVENLKMRTEKRKLNNGVCMEKQTFKIFDWAGNDLTRWHGTFETFEDAWDYIMGDMTDKLDLKEEDYQEYDVRMDQ